MKRTASYFCCSHFYSVTALIFLLLGGCNEFSDNEPRLTLTGGDSVAIAAPRVLFESRLIEASSLQLSVRQNGQPVVATFVPGSNTWTAQVSVAQGEEFELSIEWSVTSPARGTNVVLARFNGRVGPVNSNQTVTLDSSDYTLIDDNGDSISNLAEVNSERADPSLIFNSAQTNCYTSTFFQEAMTLLVPAVVPNLINSRPEQLGSVVDQFGMNDTNIVVQQINIGNEDRTTFVSPDFIGVADLLQVNSAGRLNVTHTDGVPEDSVGAIFERDVFGELQLLAFDDDSVLPDGTTTARFQFGVNLVAGGYCAIYHAYFLREPDGVASIPLTVPVIHESTVNQSVSLNFDLR